MTPKIRQLVESFPELLTLRRGEPESEVRELQAGPLAATDSLIFVGNKEHLAQALDSRSDIWVVSKEIEPSVPARVRNLLVSPNTQLAMALIGRKFYPPTRDKQIMGETIHPRAVVSPSARLGAGCIVGPGAVIGDNCDIGEGCVIGANSVLEPYVKIGAGTHIHPMVFIGHTCEIGRACEIKPNSTIGGEGFGYAQDSKINHHRITHYGRVIVEDRVHIGSGVTIDRGTFLDSRIGAGTKIDNHCHFGHNIVIGQNTIVTGGMITAGSTTLGSYCVFGGRTTVKGHLSICDGVQLAGLTAVGKSITKPGAYAGFPMQELKDDMRTRAALKHLPSLVKQVSRIVKHLGLSKENESEA